MPTTGLSQTASLLEDLSTETLTTEYSILKAQYDDLVKRDEQSLRELEKTNTLLEEARRAGALNQREKELIENKLLGVTNNKHESEGLLSDLRQSMALLRSENARLSQDNKDYYMKLVKIQSEKDAEHYQNETLKLQVTNLHLRLNNSMENEEGARQVLAAAESELRLQAESQRRQYEQMQTQKSYLEKDRDSLSSNVQELRQQVTQCKTHMESAVEKAKTAEDRLMKSEANIAATKKNYEELMDRYEKQLMEAEEKIANFSADLELVQQKAVDEQTKLQHENDALRDQLTEASDRIQVTRRALDKLIGEKDTPRSSSPTSPSPSPNTSTSIIPSNLLKMLKQYESTGKHWDDIYTEFFELRDNYTRLTSINDELKTINRQLLREEESHLRYQQRLESELERLRKKSDSYASLAENFANLKSSSTNEISSLKKKIDDLQRKNNNLDATVSDTSYQLCYLLRHVECQYESLPPEVQKTSDLLATAHVQAHHSHEKVIFRDISDLLQRNQDLLSENQQLADQLLEKTNEAASYAIASKDNNLLLKDSSGKSDSFIRDQDERIQALELRLSKTIAERDHLKQNGGVNVDSTLSVSALGSEEKLQLSERKCQGLASELDICRQEMESELHKQRQEVMKINSDSMLLRRDNDSLQAKVNQLMQRNTGLEQVSSSRASEISDLQSHAATRERHIGELEGRLRTLTNEIMTTNRQIETLRNDYSSISAQLKASDASYNRLLLENKELAVERMNLATLLQNMNDNLGSSTSGTTHLVEELKQHNERLSRELQNLRDTLTVKEKEIRGYQLINPPEWKDKYHSISGELKQLKTTNLELEKQLATANQDRIMAQTKLMEASQNTTSAIIGVPDSDALPSTDPAEGATQSDQLDQLADANHQIATLKRDLFIFKDRLADSDATANRITEEYNKFASESQIRIDKLSDDLAASNEKVISLQAELEKSITEQKNTISAFNDSEQQWQATKTTILQENEQLQTKVTMISQQIAELQSELNTNVQQLQQSEERYQSEVAARVQDADIIAGLRDQVQRLNVDISTSRSEVLGAKERLQSAELSYRNQKEQLETTQNETKLRLEESQKQQESLSALIQELLTKVNELRTVPNGVNGDTISNLAQDATQQLRNVSASLRREKDIWQARHADSQQRVGKLESDLEFIQHQLSTTRALLETARAEKDYNANKQSQGIKDAMNEATLYKKHNASLRSNVEQLRERVTQLEGLIIAKEEQVEPLTLKAKGLEHELVQTKELVQTLEARQLQWSARSARLLTKYNISDPQEIEQLKGELDTAKAQLDEKTKLLDEMTSSLNALEKEHQDLVANNTEIKTQLDKASELATTRGKLAFDLKKKAGELEESVKKLKEQMSEQQKNQQTEEQQSDAALKIKELEDSCQKQKAEHQAHLTRYTNLLAKARQLSAEKRSLEPLKQEKADLVTQMESLKTEIESLKEQLAKKTEETSSLQVEIGRMKAMQSMITNKNDKMKKELAALQEKIQGSGTGTKSAPPSSPGIKAPSKPSPPVTPATSSPKPTPNSTLTASAPPFVPTTKSPVSTPASKPVSPTTSTELPGGSHLKRASESDLTGEPPLKK